MKYSEIRGIFKKNDFVEMNTIFSKTLFKCVIISLSKDILRVMPIVEEGVAVAACPILAIPHGLVSSLNKTQKYNILFYSNINNNIIKNAIIAKNDNKKRNSAKI